MMTKSISDLAREAGMHGMLTDVVTTFSELQRFHDLAIAQYRESLLAGVGEPDTHCFDDDTGKDVWSYSKDQMAAAVLRATSAERALHKPNCKECAKWGKEQADNKEWIDGVAEGRRIVEKLAAAIRGQR